MGGGFFVTHSDLIATHVVLTNNRVWGGNGGAGSQDSHLGRADALGAGAAIQYSNSQLEDVLVTNNHALAGIGGDYGGTGAGGGLFFELGEGSVISATLFNNSVRGGDSLAGTGGIGAGGGLMMERQILSLDRTWVISNASYGGDGTYSGHAGGGGLYLTQPRTSEPAPDRMQATNIVIANNRSEAGTGVARWGGGGAIFSQNTELSLAHATIVSNSILSTMSGVGIVVLHDPDVGVSRADVFNTIVADHPATGSAVDAVLVQDAGTIVYLRNTLFWGNTNDIGTRYGAIVYANDTYQGSPEFVSPGSPDFNYRIWGTSAAINRGLNGYSDHDIDGKPRPLAGRSEIGAYEVPQPITLSAASMPERIRAADGPQQPVTQWVVLQNTSDQPVDASLDVQLPDPASPVSLGLASDLAVETESGSAAATADGNEFAAFDAQTLEWSGTIAARATVTATWVYSLTMPLDYPSFLVLVSQAHLEYLDGIGQAQTDGIEIPLTVNGPLSYLPALWR